MIKSMLIMQLEEMSKNFSDMCFGCNITPRQGRTHWGHRVSKETIYLLDTGCRTNEDVAILAFPMMFSKRANLADQSRRFFFQNHFQSFKRDVILTTCRFSLTNNSEDSPNSTRT